KRHAIEGEIPDSLFQKAFELVKLEAIYSNAILPQVIRGNKALRQDFIKKSGLDLFYIEELEAQYCDRNGIAFGTLEQLRDSQGS
ncbi:TIGR04442 family protein, partial [bacterium]|nr:TIGR04442 family protein [bacterium]